MAKKKTAKKKSPKKKVARKAAKGGARKGKKAAKKKTSAKKKTAAKKTKPKPRKAAHKPKPPKLSLKKKPALSSREALKSRKKASQRPVRKMGPKKKMKEFRMVRADEVSDTQSRRKKITAVKKNQWSSFERELLEMRDTIVQTVESTAKSGSPLTGTGDEADIATQNIEREILFEMSDNERKLLDQVEGALRRIEKGTFGVCESCREPIDINRMKALPFVRYCIRCQNTHESAAVLL